MSAYDMSTVHGRLHQTTWPLHQSMEKVVDLSVLSKGEPTLELYIAMLKLFYGFMNPLEDGLNRYAASIHAQTPVDALLLSA